MKIAIGSDHMGVELKNTLVQHLKEKGCEVKDMGVSDTSPVDWMWNVKRTVPAVLAVALHASASALCARMTRNPVSLNSIERKNAVDVSMRLTCRHVALLPQLSMLLVQKS